MSKDKMELEKQYREFFDSDNCEFFDSVIKFVDEPDNCFATIRVEILNPNFPNMVARVEAEYSWDYLEEAKGFYLSDDSVEHFVNFNDDANLAIDVFKELYPDVDIVDSYIINDYF